MQRLDVTAIVAAVTAVVAAADVLIVGCVEAGGGLGCAIGGAHDRERGRAAIAGQDLERGRHHVGRDATDRRVQASAHVDVLGECPPEVRHRLITSNVPGFVAIQQRDRERIEVVDKLLDSTHAPPGAVVVGSDIGREARGLAVLLLFASYENLLKTLCRGLLEAALKVRAGNRRLRAGFKIFAVYGQLQAIADSSASAIWKKHGLSLVDAVDQPRKCTVNVELFPADGSFMKTSQVQLFCDLFGLGDPRPVLREVWTALDTVVVQRNGIAHGGLTNARTSRTELFDTGHAATGKRLAHSVVRVPDACGAAREAT